MLFLRFMLETATRSRHGGCTSRQVMRSVHRIQSLSLKLLLKGTRMYTSISVLRRTGRRRQGAMAVYEEGGVGNREEGVQYYRVGIWKPRGKLMTMTMIMPCPHRRRSRTGSLLPDSRLFRMRRMLRRRLARRNPTLVATSHNSVN